MFVGVVGLNNALAAPPPQTETNLFPYSADTLSYGFVDETGQWVIEPQFDFADDFVSKAVGLAAVAALEYAPFGDVCPVAPVPVL